MTPFGGLKLTTGHTSGFVMTTWPNPSVFLCALLVAVDVEFQENRCAFCQFSFFLVQDLAFELIFSTQELIFGKV